MLFAPEIREGSRIDNTVPYREAANGVTVRYDTVRYDMRWRSYREQHRAASANAKIGFVRYDYERDVRLRNDFFGNP